MILSAFKSFSRHLLGRTQKCKETPKLAGLQTRNLSQDLRNTGTPTVTASILRRLRLGGRRIGVSSQAGLKPYPLCTVCVPAVGRASLKGMSGALRPKASGALEKQKHVLFDVINLYDYTYIALLIMTEI